MSVSTVANAVKTMMSVSVCELVSPFSEAGVVTMDAIFSIVVAVYVAELSRY